MYLRRFKMAINKKKNTDNWFKSSCIAILVVVFIAVATVGFVREKGEIRNLSEEIRKREQRLKELREQNILLQKQVVMLRSPVFLQARAKALNLGLIQIYTNTIIKFREESSFEKYTPGFLPLGVETNFNSFSEKPLVISRK